MAIPSNNMDCPEDVETQVLSNSTSGGNKVECMLWVSTWMIFSCFVVIFNKWVFTSGGFPYPLALNAMHMYCCFLAFGAVRKFAPPQIRSTIMPDADVEIPWSMYCKYMTGLSILFAVTLGAGNTAHLFSSVAFIQMMKPLNAIYASFAAFALGVEVPTSSHMIVISTVILGAFVATRSAVDYSMMGIVLQTISSCAEGSRLALVQVITSGALRLDPVTTVYHLSFLSAVVLTFATAALEWPLKLDSLQSPWILVGNCLMAVFLNVLIATVIKKTSAVIFTLCGVCKDIVLIAASCGIFGTSITVRQCEGYIVSMIGIGMYKVYKDNLTYFKENGFIKGMTFAYQSKFKK
jgi:hypothetical protein